MTQQSLGIIGGGFSGVATAFSTVLELQQRKADGQTIEALNSITILGEVTTGPAYNAQSDALILNRSVEVMDPLASTGYGFLKFLQETVPERGYTKTSFVPRGLYGDYILWLYEQTKNIGVELGIEISNAPSLAVAIDRNADGSLSVAQENGAQNRFTYLTLATGHEFEEREAVKNHPLYIAPYSTKGWEDKLALAKLIASADTEVSLLGWGGTSLDIATLIGHDFKGVIKVYAPLGNTSIPFYGKIPPSAEQITALRHLTDAFYDKVADYKNDPVLSADDIRAKIADDIRDDLFVKARQNNPAVLEQHVIDYLIIGDDAARINDPANRHIHDVAIIFNGNPVAPERQKLLQHLIAGNKIRFTRAKVNDVINHDGALELRLDGQPSVITSGKVIDGTTVRRALALDNQGQFISPLLADAIDAGLIAPASHNPRVLPTFAGDNIYAVGAITYHIANSVGVFHTGIKAVSKHIGAAVTGTTNVVDFVAELELRHKDGGKPNLILDVRDPDELQGFAVINGHDSARQVHNASLRGGEVTADNPLIQHLPSSIPIHVLCEGGVRSAKAIELLQGRGLTLINIAGGARTILEKADAATLETLFSGTRVSAVRAPGYRSAAPTLKSACG